MVVAGGGGGGSPGGGGGAGGGGFREFARIRFSAFNLSWKTFSNTR